MTKTTQPKKEEEILFSVEEGDEELRDAIALVVCENRGDTNTLNLVLHQDGKVLSDAQRNWLNALLARDGMDFNRFRDLIDD